jgi:hypothetical protein
LDESLGEFEEFIDEFTTYTASEDHLVSSNMHRRKGVYCIDSDKPRLKFIKEERDKLPFISRRVTHSKNQHQRKNLTAKENVIAVEAAIFRGNFESGNLQKAQKVAPGTYSITLNKELSSNRTSTWFYFAVEGLKGEVKMVIKGFTKPCSLFNDGMKVCFREADEGVWRRGGTNIKYIRSEDEGDSDTFELHFCFFFRTNSGAVEFAYCFPYPYSHLIKFVGGQQSVMMVESLGKTYEGRDIPLLTIGNPQSKYCIVVSARAHPGETVGSWMMEGFLKELIGGGEYSRYLR